MASPSSAYIHKKQKERESDTPRCRILLSPAVSVSQYPHPRPSPPIRAEKRRETPPKKSINQNLHTRRRRKKPKHPPPSSLFPPQPIHQIHPPLIGPVSRQLAKPKSPLVTGQERMLSATPIPYHTVSYHTRCYPLADTSPSLPPTNH